MFADINITAGTIRWFLLGNALGAVTAAFHYYILKFTVNYCLTLEPITGKLVVMLVFYLRFILLALILFGLLRMAGSEIALGLLAGITLYQISWIIRQVRTS